MKEIKAYQETAVGTQNKGRLIVMLYEGAVKFMKMAVDEIEEGSYEAKNNHIIKAQDIINELNAVLDTDAGGEIAVNLRNLYNFMYKHLVDANAQNDTGKIQEVIELMEELNKGWKAITS